jgi:pimeloyl-ACP methyl ester carboxylesterase
MHQIYKSSDGERQVEERYREFLKRWPVPSEQIRIPTRHGETFVVASGPSDAPPLVLLHGGASNSTIWMGDVAAYAQCFRVYCVDVIGEPGLSAPSRPALASDAYANWLTDVLNGLAVQRASFAGVSLGGWLALDFAIRCPERVERLAVLCPGGVGRQKLGIVFETMILRAFGKWGKRKLTHRVLGRPPADPPPAVRAFIEFFALIHANFRPRMVKLPVFSDAALRSVKAPLLAIVGGRDVLLDSGETKRRLEENALNAKVMLLPQAGHLIPGQTPKLLEFLKSA